VGADGIARPQPNLPKSPLRSALRNPSRTPTPPIRSPATSPLSHIVVPSAPPRVVAPTEPKIVSAERTDGDNASVSSYETGHEAFDEEPSLALPPKGQPDVNIVLEPPLADPNAPPADRKVMKEMLAKGLLRGVIFSAEDCDATFEHIRAGGGEVLQEPMDQPYGVRDCAFRDPSGNLIRFNQRKA